MEHKKVKYLSFKNNHNFIMLCDEASEGVFKNSENITKMSIKDFAINVELLSFFNLVSMYAKSYINQTPLSENIIDITFNLNRKPAELEEAITFMIH